MIDGDARWCSELLPVSVAFKKRNTVPLLQAHQGVTASPTNSRCDTFIMVGYHNGVAQGGTNAFIPAKTFAGVKPGFFFGQGPQGLGYVALLFRMMGAFEF